MGASFLAQNAGKRSITLNLKIAERPRGVRAARRHRPTSWSRISVPASWTGWGSATTALKAVKPDIIYCAISGFGQDGPLKLNPAYDQIIQGLSRRDERHRRRAIRAAAGRLSGGRHHGRHHRRRLRSRRRCSGASAAGEGEFIDVSMLESSLVAMGWAVSNWLIAGVKPAADGQREHDREPLGHVPHRRRAAQHRGQQAGAVRDACAADRARGSRDRSALRRARGSQAPPFRTERRDREGAGGASRRRTGRRS